MPRALRVHLNRSDHHEVAARTRRFAADGPFVLEVRNHGDGSHVHLAASGDLALDADLPDDNPYVPAGETLEVPVDVVTDLRPATGSVTVTTGYGRNEVSVEVRVNGEAAVDATEDGTADGADEAADAEAADDRPLPAPAALGGAVATLRSVGGGLSRPTVPDPSDADAATLLVLVLAALAVVAATAMYAVFESALVGIATVVVVLTVLGAGGYLLVR